jgi:hypothetical protein
LHFDVTLNVVWLLLGLLAMGLAAQLFSGPGRQRSFASRCFHFLRIALVIVALFPFISASDDVLRMQHYTSKPDTQSQGTQEQGKHRGLIALYEAMDSPLLTGSVEVAVTLLPAWTLEFLFSELTGRCAPMRAGRSPPPFSATA